MVHRAPAAHHLQQTPGASGALLLAACALEDMWSEAMIMRGVLLPLSAEALHQSPQQDDHLLDILVALQSGRV